MPSPFDTNPTYGPLKGGFVQTDPFPFSNKGTSNKPPHGPLKTGYIPTPEAALPFSPLVGNNSTEVGPLFDLERRGIPPETIELLGDRASLYGRSLTSDVYGEKYSHAAIDGIYFKLRGETVRCDPKFGGFLEIPNSETNPDTVDNIYSNRFTPPITVEQLTLSLGGDYGSVWNLEGTIIVYTVDDLEKVEENFLIPGNKIYLSAGYKPGWAPFKDKASNFQLPNNWEADPDIRDFALRVTGYTFAYDSGKWTCTFKAVGIQDIFLNMRIPYTIESRNIKYTDGKGNQQVAQGIGQALYFSDAVGNEQTSLSAAEDGRVIKGSFLDFLPLSEDYRGSIIAFNYSYWHNQHYILTGDDGTLYDDPIKADYGVRLYFTFDYIVNRLIDDLVLRNTVYNTGLLERSLDKLLDKKKWFVTFDELSSEKGEVPPESELPFLSADPAKIIFLGRANYKSPDGLGVDFTEVVEGKNGSDYPKAVTGNTVTLKDILIHGSVIETALRQSSELKEFTVKGSPAKSKALVLTVKTFFQHICNAINNSTGGFVTPRLVENPILDTISSGAKMPSLIINAASATSLVYECVEFDPIKGDGNTRALNISSGQGSQEYQASMMLHGTTLGEGGEIGSMLRDCNKELKPLQDQTKNLLEQKIKDIKKRLGPQHFISTDVQDAVATWHQFYNFRKSNLEKGQLEDEGGKLYLFPSLSLTATIHGAWGFKMGQFISSTAVPNQYRVNGADSFNGRGIPFMLKQVTHTLNFAKNDWNTRLDAYLCYPPDTLSKIDLRSKVQD